MIESKENHYSYESKKRNNETLHFEHTNVLKKIFLFILLFAVLFTFSPLTYAEQNDRYTVLVLDVSGPTTFKEPASWMNLFGVHYTSDSSIESVKGAAQRFLEDTKRAIGKNYIAIVTYTAEAQVVIDFTSDIDALQNALDSINPIIEEKDEYEDGDRNICAGLECAYTLLNNIHGGNITKNLLLCTTGVTDNGEYSYDGWYNENTIGSTWQNEITEIRLYAYANPAIACANMIKANGVTIYVLGIFDPIEGNMPSNSSVGDIAKFFRLTARDIASSDNTFYPVEDVETLDFYFGELQDDLTGSALLKLYNNSTAYKDNSFTDWEGGALGKGGHFEEILWGPSLFEVPATQIFRSDISAPDSINRNLAMLGGSLSAAAYDADYMIQAYMDLGFQKDDVFLYSYPGSQNNRSEARRNGKKFADDNDLGFAIASRSMQINGSDCDLLIITLRGTHNIWEAVKDGTMNLDKNFYSYYAWDWVYEFEEDVFAGIDDYRAVHTELGSRPMKVLITGHSLAGAAANLVAARFNMFCDRNDWFSDALSIDDIYAYTYGAIDAISDRKYKAENRLEALLYLREEPQ